jgi:hypothetical protein
LCCALNCTEPGTTTPTASFRVSTQLAVVLGNVLVPRISFLQSPIPARSSPTPGQRQDSNPAYILHLALLI